MIYQHPDICEVCNGTLIELRTRTEANGVTIGLRTCPQLMPQAQDKPQVAEPELCPRRYQLPGLTNDILKKGGAPCILKSGHPQQCRVIVSQETQDVTLSMPQDPDEEPRVVSVREK